ncbi:MAG: leucine-rich repeat domain-containing protein [Muribaculaceae bacterium]|nr:leucine-rich repeat domain-containing protein [Muribaculaceae bacterium]
MYKILSFIKGLIVLLIGAVAIPSFASQVDFVVDNIAYNISDDGLGEGECKVTINPGFTYEGRITIPENVTHDGKSYKVVAIGDSAFRKQDKLIGVDFPNSLKVIEDLAFSGSGLRKTEFPKSLEKIGESAFNSGCEGEVILTSIKEIGRDAFRDSHINKLVISGDLKEIKNYTFYGCDYLKEVQLPEGLISIDDHAFYECDRLTTISLPNSVEYIGSHAFGYCYKLELAELPKSLKTIDDYGFERCYSLEINEMPESLEKIGKFAFNNCGFGDTLDLKFVKELGQDAFSNCGFKKLILSPELKYTGYNSFQGGQNLEIVEIPDGVVTINSGTFNFCKKLHTVNFGNTVATIEAYAFSYCYNLKNLELPNSLNRITNWAFDQSGIKDVALPGSLTRLDPSTFSNVKLGTLTLAPSDKDLQLPTSTFRIEGQSHDANYQFTGVGIDTLITGRTLHLVEEEGLGEDPLSGISSFIFLKDTDATPVLDLYHFRNPDAQGQPCNLVLGINVKTPNDFSKMILKTLTMADPVPPVCPTFSKEQYDTLELYVPAEGIEAYKAAEGWKNFFSINVSGIEKNVVITDRSVVARYDLQGRPVKEGYEGIVIVHYSDGTVRKELAR